MNTVRAKCCVIQNFIKVQLLGFCCAVTLAVAGCTSNQQDSESSEGGLTQQGELGQIESGQGVTRVDDHVTPEGTAYSFAYLPDAEQFSIHLVWPNHWIKTSGIAVASQLGIDLMSSGGAGERSAEQVREDIIELQSSATLVSSPDHIYATVTATPENLDNTLAVIADVLAKPELEKQQFEVLKAALIGRVRQRQLKHSARLWGLARRALTGNSVLTDYWNNTPIERVVEPITFENIQSWHAETITRNGVSVAVAGALDTDSAGLAIDQLLANLPTADKPEGSQAEQSADASRIDTSSKVLEQTGFTVLLHDETVQTTRIAIIGLLPPSRTGNEIHDVVAVAALGKGKDSRIVRAVGSEFSETPEEEPKEDQTEEQSEESDEARLQASVTSTLVDTNLANFSREHRVFGISTEVENDRAVEMLALIEEAYQSFNSADLTDEETLPAAVSFANSVRQSANRPDLVAYGLGQLVIDDLPRELLKSVIADTLSLRADDINQRIVEHYPDWSTLIKVVMSNDAALIPNDCVITSVEELDQCEL